MKSIIFNTEMVQATLNGTKSQFRLPIKTNEEFYRLSGDNGEARAVFENNSFDSFYKIGDILYVKETWRLGYWDMENGKVAIDYKVGKDKSLKFPKSDFFNNLIEKSCNELYKKNIFPNEDGNYNWEKYNSPLRWYSSICMPKELARIFLKITNVRVERLQDLILDDIEAEGFKSNDKFYTSRLDSALDWWESLWNLTAKQGYKWEDNPYVFVYDFERVEKNSI